MPDIKRYIRHLVETYRLVRTHETFIATHAALIADVRQQIRSISDDRSMLLRRILDLEKELSAVKQGKRRV